MKDDQIADTNNKTPRVFTCPTTSSGTPGEIKSREKTRREQKELNDLT